jgi:hypothetical protein
VSRSWPSTVASNTAACSTGSSSSRASSTASAANTAVNGRSRLPGPLLIRLTGLNGAPGTLPDAR